MKNKKLLLPLSLLAILALVGCSSNSSSSSSSGDDPSGNTSNGGTTAGEITVEDTEDEPEVTNDSSFSLTTEDGTISNSGNVYTLSAAGTYTASGELEEGQIVIEAGESDEVVLELNGVTITNSSDAPIKAVTADKVEISAKSDTSNKVSDNRSAKSSTASEDDSVAEGAINAKCDLKLKGSGTLVVTGSYNNGVHTTDDLEIQKETLYVTAYNNALKGKDSVTIESGTLTLVSKNGNGIKTDNTDVSSSGNQRGIVTINGGDITIDSVYDGIDASYDLVINEENDDSASTDLTVKTGKNSSYSSNYSSANSAKGLKAANTIEIAAGEVTVKATDDAIHANYGDSFDNGSTGKGNITISGGTVQIASGDDGLHADNTLTVSGGVTNITGASEGLESNHIAISGGEVHVYGTDDGVNASEKINETPTIVVSGGFLDVSVSTGDTDGIDSNGNFTQTGGLIVTRGGYGTSGGMSTGLDIDGTAKITGGTFIAFNGLETTPSTSNGVLYAYYGSTGNQGNMGGNTGPGGGWSRSVASSTSFAAGTYTLSGGSLSKTWSNEYTYSAFLIYSSEMSTGTSYTLKNGSSTVLSWTQSSSSQSIS